MMHFKYFLRLDIMLLYTILYEVTGSGFKYSVVNAKPPLPPPLNLLKYQQKVRTQVLFPC